MLTLGHQSGGAAAAGPAAPRAGRAHPASAPSRVAGVAHRRRAPAHPALAGSASSRGAVLRAAAYSITFLLPDGAEAEVQCSAETYILDAADDAGLDLPSSCRAGACTSCCARLLSGEVDNADQNFLDEEQQRKGFVLICTAYPKSDCVIRTHQEEALY